MLKFISQYHLAEGFNQYIKHFLILYIFCTFLVGFVIGLLLFLSTLSFESFFNGFIVSFFGVTGALVVLFISDIILRYSVYKKFGDFSFSVDVAEKINLSGYGINSLEEIKEIVKCDKKFKKSSFTIKDNILTFYARPVGLKYLDIVNIRLIASEINISVRITSKPNNKIAKFDQCSNYENVQIIKKCLKKIGDRNH